MPPNKPLPLLPCASVAAYTEHKSQADARSPSSAKAKMSEPIPAPTIMRFCKHSFVKRLPAIPPLHRMERGPGGEAATHDQSPPSASPLPFLAAPKSDAGGR